jgi:hypothetical protein
MVNHFIFNFFKLPLYQMESNNPINENQQMQIDTDPPQNIPISPNAFNRWAGQNE